MNSDKLLYFHAGALFTLNELAGNALMANAIRQESDGRYQPILPQDLEIDPNRTSAIRDADLLALLGADVALFHFDGTELDSAPWLSSWSPSLLIFQQSSCAAISGVEATAILIHGI